ncbi:MAG TPA: tyrosine-type recombinase/integrase, partial [Solirubrobacteraceae bacterium]|nr:tyrosine-type recombinase/integrase [Solirubrobacteraceae bacterium]
RQRDAGEDGHLVRYSPRDRQRASRRQARLQRSHGRRASPAAWEPSSPTSSSRRSAAVGGGASGSDSGSRLLSGTGSRAAPGGRPGRAVLMAGAKLEALGGADQGIYRRGDRYAVIYRDEYGRQRQRSARTLTEARTLRAVLIGRVKDGRHRELSREKVDDYALEWIERYQGRNGNLREDTRAEYRRDLHRYVLPQLGGLKLAAVTRRHVSRWVAWLADERAQGDRARAEAIAAGRDPQAGGVYLADGTIERIATVLRAMFSSAVDEELVAANPAHGLRLPKRDEARRIASGGDLDEDAVPARALTTDQLAVFLAVTPARYRLLMRLLAATGLRISEALALRWTDVVLNGSSPHVHVRRAWRRGRFGPPKSKHGRRKVPLSHELVLELRRHQRTSEYPEPMHLVFCTATGKPYEYANLHKAALEPAREEAGVPWAGFHTLRHTCATRLFAGGRNAVQVQRWLGHHSPAFTLSVYVHLLDEDLGEALPEPRGSARGQRDRDRKAEIAVAA